VVPAVAGEGPVMVLAAAARLTGGEGAGAQWSPSWEVDRSKNLWHNYEGDGLGEPIGVTLPGPSHQTIGFFGQKCHGCTCATVNKPLITLANSHFTIHMTASLSLAALQLILSGLHSISYFQPPIAAGVALIPGVTW
jgi:hypothetical protein